MPSELRTGSEITPFLTLRAVTETAPVTISHDPQLSRLFDTVVRIEDGTVRTAE
ncbi:hypothetical protein ACFFQF_24730 [Haladaptatus pallidirubidus]|uniref:Uncharacterized protein n=1 Tax=Haladaptatus pallidirubidus TaxID=1008152 RepID=A0AAV3UK54_9EURY|nr:hypothetical protein [Haladaptatus pallidirubidus]